MNVKLALAALISVAVLSCKSEKKTEKNTNESVVVTEKQPFFKISLAQWSLNEAIRSGEMDPLDFAEKAHEMGFEGIEYVSQLYTPLMETYDNDKIALDSILPKMKAKSQEFQVENVLIMVDGEGNLAAASESERNQAVEDHKKWVDAAKYLGCHAIRVNLIGAADKEVWKNSAIDGLGKLADYGAKQNIEVTVENHGGYSSDAALLMEVITAIDKENCGTLPDFGNFCMERENGEMWGAPCVKEYDKYKGIEEMMPKALAVSAKTYDFNDSGEETSMNFTRILQTVKDAGYTGFIGVEYEGENHTPEEGILLTKELLLSAAQKLN
ncbi:sugar phosphate isomerase/epimerase family protein [Leeuwenhoekiella marinoflava]|uniref:Sugar phosphate isomerase/epimerase n=2 Tax=Leeuwenhoekiella marinoflava TaxID=988 RepID=A0A4Q0PRE1_9FLAO|nr:sugar phosphate isomerase/epimerase family protein [Leeuwenhoekiella marinoflava]RXG33124.1 sugar phosphate isomerase/epimerase [Leeuwenhoekiella marinoflava]SHE39216.1 Sugar phosphate isomerase/epimerase [Leeuwenhoekiella marinoflava DSM 3653]